MINEKIQFTQNLDVGQLVDMINQLENNTKVAVIIFSVAYIVVGIIIAVVLSKFVVYPINKLIKSAEKITEEESKEKKKNKNKKINEMNNLENVFGIMTTELKEKLSEVSTQKNQIETILLHMTDRNNCL